MQSTPTTPRVDASRCTHGRQSPFRARLTALIGAALVALALVGANLVLPAAPTHAQGTAPTTASPQSSGPTPRPDLALGLRDLPPGYEEAPSLELMLDDIPLHDRVIRQTQPGAGPGWVWTMTYRTANPVTPDRLTSLSEDLAVFFMRALSDVATLSNWQEANSASLGSLAKMYTFDFRVAGSDLVGDGALAVFGPGDYLSYLAVLNVDGQSVTDLGMLSRVVNSRVDTDAARSSRP